MPYNIDKSLGGDTPENTKFVENCISSIKDAYTLEEKIAICKEALRRKKEGKSSEIDEVELYFNNIKINYCNKLIKSSIVSSPFEAIDIYNRELVCSDYDLRKIQKGIWKHEHKDKTG